MLRVLYRVRVDGRENVPAHGRVLVYANHIHAWDPPVVGCVLNRQVFFMAKHELFAYPILRPLLIALGAFPVKRGQADRTAMRRAMTLLEQERVVGMFPEGTRRRDGRLGKAAPGAVLLAVHCKAPLLPIAIKGPYRLFRPLRVRIGKPFELAEFYDRKLSAGDLERAGEILMQKLAEMLQESAPTVQLDNPPTPCKNRSVG